MKFRSIGKIIFSLGILSANVAAEMSGNISFEGRSFLQDGLYDEQTNSVFSIAMQPEWRTTFNGDKKFTFIPFYRFDNKDNERSHADIRQMDINIINGNYEFQLGISKEFWGVTESQHLVDIINQTDVVEGVEGDVKLGQPMLRISRHLDYGSLALYLLPYFRERTFPGTSGRFRSSLVVDTDVPLYESDDKEKNIDYAFRWRHTFGDIDIGLSYFDGTSREPELIQIGTTIYAQPYYRQIQQYSLDLQFTRDAWLWKLEILQRKNSSSSYIAAVIGTEYTFSNLYGGRSDLALLAEYNLDSRDELATTDLQNDIFIGARLSFNDVNSTTLFFRIIYDFDYSSKSLRFEASRRLAENYRLAFIMQLLTSIDPRDTILDEMRADDYIQLNLQRFF